MTDLRALGDQDGGELYYINIVHCDTVFTVCCFFGVGFRVICGFTRVCFGVGFAFLQGWLRVVSGCIRLYLGSV